MNPKQIRIYAKGFQAKLEAQRDYDNFLAHLQGIYFRDALLSTVGNMFAKKGAKPMEYPAEPYEFKSEEQRELTEEEKDIQRQAFLASLFTMQANFEASKGNSEQS